MRTSASRRFAITDSSGTPAVYLIKNDPARLCPVTVHELVGELRRIEGGDIATGAQLVVGGMHYVSDGQAVRVKNIELAR